MLKFVLILQVSFLNITFVVLILKTIEKVTELFFHYHYHYQYDGKDKIRRATIKNNEGALG